jgi:hypothetical protein
MALHDLVDRANARLEAEEVLAAMVRERHLGEGHQRVAQLLQPDLRAVSGDVARLLEPPEACEARARDRPTASARSTLVTRPFFCSWHRMRRSSRSSVGAFTFSPSPA